MPYRSRLASSRLLSRILLIFFCCLFPAFALNASERKLKVIGACDQPPFEFINDKGELVGFDLEILEIVMNRLGTSYELTLKGGAETYRSLSDGEMDLITRMVVTEKRKKEFFFSQPYGTVYPCLLTRKGSSIMNLDDLKGKSIFVQRNSFLLELIMSKDFGCNIIQIDNINDGIFRLNVGEADAILGGADHARYFMFKHNITGLNIHKLNVFPQDFGFASRDEQLIRDIDRILIQLRKEPVFAEIHNKWFGGNEAFFLRENIILLLISLFSIVLLLILISYFLRIKVRRALAEVEDRNRKISLAIRNGNISIWGFDMKQNRFYNIDGSLFPQAGMSLDHLLDRIHPEDLNVIISQREKLISGEIDTAVMELRCLDLNSGEWSFYRNDVTVIRSKCQSIESFIGTTRNITQEKEHERKESQLLHSLRTAVQASGLIMLHYDVEKDTWYTLSKTGFRKSRYSTERLKDFIHPEYLDIWESTLYNLLSGNSLTEEVVLRIFNSRKEMYEYYEYIFNSLTDHTGKVYRIVGSQKNITVQQERRMKRETIIRSLDMAMEVGKIMAWSYDVKNHYTRIYYGDRTIESRSVCDTMHDINVHPDDREDYRTFFLDLLAGKTERYHTVARIKPDDDSVYVPYEIVVRLERDSDGDIKSLFGIRKDISEIYHMQGELNQKVDLLQAIYKNMPAGMIYYDKNGDMKEINDWMMNILGLKDKSVLIDHINFFTESIMPEEVKANLRQGRGGSYVFEYKNITRIDPAILRDMIPSGHCMFLEIHCNPIFDESGNIMGYLSICSDISERREKESHLEELQSNLALALDAGNTVSWIFNADTRMFQILHGEALAGNGMSLDENLSNMHPDDRSLLLGMFDDILSGRKEKCMAVFRFLKQDDWHYYNSYMIGRKKDGQVIHITGTQKDITADIHTQKLLKDYKLQTELIIRASDVVFWEYDCHTQKIKAYNEPLNGYDINQVLTLQDYLDRTHPDDLAKIGPYLRIMKEGIARDYKFDIRMKVTSDRDWDHVTFTGTPIEIDPDGKVLRFAGMRRDNTTLVKLHREVEAYAQKIEYILKGSDSKLWDYNLKDRMLSLYTPDGQSERIPLEEYLLKVSVDQHDEVRSIFESMNTGTIGEYSQQRKYYLAEEKRYSYVLINGLPIVDEDGTIVSYTGMRRDITELIETQLSLEKEKERALQADQLKSAFLANMSHEIRTPLNAIVGFSELLQLTDNPAERKEYLRIINNSNDLLLRLVGDILDLSKIESGMLEFIPEPFDFALFFEELSMAFAERIDKSHIRFTASHPYRQCVVELDRNRMVQILSNFLTNAIKYTPEGFIHMEYEYIDGGIRMSVTDSGIGIPADKHDRIFRRFEKLDSFAQGVGLGLSICKAIVTAMGGEIGFDSESGKGSTFWIWVRCANEILEYDESLTV